MLPRVQILSTGEFLKVSAKGLSVVIRSLLFQDQGNLFGSVGYPFTLPLEDNREAIKNAHIINSDASLRTFMVRIWLGAMPWKMAKFNFILKGKDLSGTLQIDLGTVALKLKTLRLNNLPGDPNHEQLNVNNEAGLIAYMNSSVLPGSTLPMFFFPYKNDGAYMDATPADYPSISFPVNTIINSWSIDAEGRGSFMVQGNKETQSPAYKLIYVLKRIIRYLGFDPVGKWLDDPIANKISIQSNIPVPTYWIIPDFPYFMPDIAVSDLLVEVRKRFGVLIDFNQFDSTCIVESLENLMATTDETDLRDVQVISFDELSTSLRAYSISEVPANKDAAFSDEDKERLPVLKVGELDDAVELNEVLLMGASTKMINENSPAWAQNTPWRIPWIKTPVVGSIPLGEISTIEYKERSNFALRFLYYHGLTSTADGYLYPYGSSDNVDVVGKTISDFSLAIDAEKGIKLAVRGYYDFLKNSKPFEMGFELSPQLFMTINPKSRILIREPVTQATVPCLLSEVSADLTVKETIMAKATLYPILLPVNTAEVLPVQTEPDEPPFDNGTVYVKLTFADLGEEYYSIPPPPRAVRYARYFAKFYADVVGTIPKDVTSLNLRIKVVFRITSAANYPPQTSYQIISCTSAGGEFKIYDKVPVSTISSEQTTSYSYELATNSLYHILP